MKKLQYNKKPRQSQSLSKPNKNNLKTHNISHMKTIRSKTHNNLLNWKKLAIVGNNLAVHKSSQKKMLTEPHNHQLRSLYEIAITKLMMDMFRKNQVQEPLEMPEKVLYFLGSAFQKIKMNPNGAIQQQFYNQCIRLYRKSTNDDIREFVQLMASQKQQDQKNDISLSKITIESMVQDRITFSGQQKRMRNNHQPQKQSSQKEKATSFKNKCNQRLANTQEQISPEKYQAIKGIKYKKQKKVPKVLGQINNFENTVTLNQRNNQIPYFKGSKNLIKADTQDKAENSNRSYSQNQHQEKEPLNIFQQFAKNGGKDQPRQQNNDKIQRLTNRLDGYIRQNAIRLQKSKNARIHLS